MRRGAIAWRLYALWLVQLTALVLVAFGGAHFAEQVPEARGLAWALPFAAAALVLGLGAVLTSMWVVRPLERIARSARAAEVGAIDALAGLSRGNEIDDVGRSLDEMTGRVKQLLLAERELLANVSHELRTPLARIRVAIDLAVEGDNDAARAALADIAFDLAELEGIVDDVLTATRLAAADAGLEPSTFALHLEELAPASICERAVERFTARHPTRKLMVELAPDLPAIVVDPVLFRRVIDNVLENADKYSPEPNTPISLSLTGDAHSVVYRITDQGIGIAPEDLPHIFTAFFRSERSRSRRAGGVGLGLTLAKRIVEAHEATIQVESAPTRGTIVTIRVPVHEAAPA